MTKPKRVAFIGAGGVGKTTLCKLFEADGYKFHPSSVRAFYKTQGILKEDDYLELSEQRRHQFQKDLMLDFRKHYESFLLGFSNSNTVTDRTVFDHLAYFLYGVPGITLEELTFWSYDCAGFMTDHGFYTHLVYIPYPQPFMETQSTEDGFRAVQHGKNFAVSSIMYNLFASKIGANHSSIQRIYLPRSNRTPKQNYEFIRGHMV